MQIANYTFVKTFQKGNGFTIRSSHNDTDPLLLLLMLQFRDIWIVCHSVPEWIWIKGSYLSQWLPQGERGPPKESKSRWIEILHGGSH